MPQLERPTARVRLSYVDAGHEMQREGRWPGVDLAVLSRADAFAAFVASLAAEEDEPSAEGLVTQTTLWYVDGDVWLGRVSLRHRLTDQLRHEGGHIGYEVRPTARRRGHATAMLRDVLPIAADRGIGPALITCNSDNEPSRRIIESAGGALWSESEGRRRYWVPTGA